MTHKTELFLVSGVYHLAHFRGPDIERSLPALKPFAQHLSEMALRDK